MRESKTFISVLFFLFSFSLMGQRAVVYNFDDQANKETFIAQNLDQTHANLLDPSVSTDDIQLVIQSWKELHMAIGNYISEKDFSWDTDSENIPMFQKIYFHSDGTIKVHFFNVLDDSISPEKLEEFADLLEEFAQTAKISISKSEPFAQCGKIRYSNKQN